MGVDYSIHLGPYVECKVGKKKIDTREVVEEMNERLCFPLGDDFAKRMREEKTHYFFGNFDYGIKRKNDFNIRHDDVQMQEITFYLIAEGCVKFELFFSPELDYLRKIYGEGNVQIKWGLFNQIW